jgi:hypothetical protein
VMVLFNMRHALTHAAAATLLLLLLLLEGF